MNIQSNAVYGLINVYKNWYVDEQTMPYANETIAGFSGDPTELEKEDVQIASTMTYGEFEQLLKDHLRIVYASSKSDMTPDMTLVQGGSFSMGWNDPYAFNDTKNVHKVTVESFFMAQTEVTQEQYAKVMLDNPSDVWGKTLPMDALSWFDAVNYCKAVSLQLKTISAKVKDEIRNLSPQKYTEYALAHPEHKLWRLPTEAEWEFAARGGNKSKKYTFSGSNDAAAVAVLESRIPKVVASKNANELGLFDMSGNVHEWCSDFYQDAYPLTDQKNPTGPATGTERVMRGGATDTISDSFLYTTTRRAMPPDFDLLIGLRPVRSAGK